MNEIFAIFAIILLLIALPFLNYLLLQVAFNRRALHKLQWELFLSQCEVKDLTGEKK